MKLKEAEVIVNKIISLVHSLILVGSIKRKIPEVNDIDFVTVYNLNRVLKTFSLYFNIEIIAEGKKFVNIKLVKYNINVNIWRTTNTQMPYMLISRNYPKGYEIGLRNTAKQNGYLLNSEGLYDRVTNKQIKGLTTEKDIINRIGATYHQMSYFKE